MHIRIKCIVFFKDRKILFLYLALKTYKGLHDDSDLIVRIQLIPSSTTTPAFIPGRRLPPPPPPPPCCRHRPPITNPSSSSKHGFSGIWHLDVSSPKFSLRIALNCCDDNYFLLKQYIYIHTLCKKMQNWHIYIMSNYFVRNVKGRKVFYLFIFLYCKAASWDFMPLL